MREHRRWLMIPVASGLVALIGIGLGAGRADDPKRLTAEDVLALWEPKPEGVVDFQQFRVAPRESSALAASTFRIVGPSFGALWNHYADLCGIKDRYEANRLVMSGGTGARGTYVVSDRASSTVKGERVLSVFVLRTDRYTVTATIQPDPDGKALRGSIVAAIP